MVQVNRVIVQPYNDGSPKPGEIWRCYGKDFLAVQQGQHVLMMNMVSLLLRPHTFTLEVSRRGTKHSVLKEMIYDSNSI